MCLWNDTIFQMSDIEGDEQSSPSETIKGHRKQSEHSSSTDITQPVDTQDSATPVPGAPGTGFAAPGTSAMSTNLVQNIREQLRLMQQESVVELAHK